MFVINTFMMDLIFSVTGYVLAGYAVSCFLSVSYGVLMNRHEHDK